MKKINLFLIAIIGVYSFISCKKSTRKDNPQDNLTLEEKIMEGKWAVQSITTGPLGEFITAADADKPQSGELIIDHAQKVYLINLNAYVRKAGEINGTATEVTLTKNIPKPFVILNEANGNIDYSTLDENAIVIIDPDELSANHPPNEVSIVYRHFLKPYVVIKLKRQ